MQPVFQAISLGSIQPAGWFKDQLELEANGLAGNLFDFYRFVHDSEWIGGTWEYSPLDEASPYWFNGLVPLAFGLGDERIKSQVKYYMNYVLDHQQSDGWLGFEKTHETRGLWARCLLLLGLMVGSASGNSCAVTIGQNKDHATNKGSNTLRPIQLRQTGSSTQCTGTLSLLTAC